MTNAIAPIATASFFWSEAAERSGADRDPKKDIVNSGIKLLKNKSCE